MNKYEKVYYDIKDKIKNGIIKSGDFLKKEDDLAKDYNFSKLTVRKALSMLERKKINCTGEKKFGKYFSDFNSNCTGN